MRRVSWLTSLAPPAYGRRRDRGGGRAFHHDYIRHVRAFTAFVGRSPDSATPEDLRRFQLHQTETGVRPPTINGAVAALRFFFSVTRERPDMARHLTFVREPRRIRSATPSGIVWLSNCIAPPPLPVCSTAESRGGGYRTRSCCNLGSLNLEL
jgi:integrase/recombinase XerD